MFGVYLVGSSLMRGCSEIFDSIEQNRTGSPKEIKSTGVITKEFVGCLTESNLDEFIGYSSRKDFNGMQSLLGNFCFSLNGKKYSLIESGLIRVKVRIYAGGDSLALWTVREAVQ